MKKVLEQYLQESEKRFAELKKEKYPDEAFPSHGTWEVALKIDSKKKLIQRMCLADFASI